MDYLTIATLVTVAVVGIVMLSQLTKNIWAVITIVLAIMNDIADIGLLTLSGYSWMWDAIVFGLTALWCQNLGAFIILLDAVPVLPIPQLPLTTIGLIIAYYIKEKKIREEK